MTKRSKAKFKSSQKTGRYSKYILAVLAGAASLAAIIALVLQFRGELLNEPILDIKITRMIVYGDLEDLSNRGGNVRWIGYKGKGYAPWIGADLEIINRGRKTATLKTYQMAAYYEPLHTWGQADYWHLRGTKDDVNPFGRQHVTSVEPGNLITEHLTFLLFFEPNGFAEGDKTLYEKIIDEARVFQDIFKQVNVRVWDIQGQKFDSEKFFDRGKQVVAIPQGKRAKIFSTYFERGAPPVITFSDKDYER